MLTTASAEAKARHLQQEVAGHKSAIHFHRRALAGAKADLVALEAECRRYGIALVIVKPPHPRGEGDIHGPDSGS